LILDEPTNGLDPLVQAEFNKVILELKKSGSTIFISSHILSEVQELCDEFIFIKQGKVMAQLTKAELGAKSGEVITIKPNASNREKITKLLKSNGINYKLAAGNLEDTFMQYYEDGANA
jgi:ABC-2 type transport system ATP-binding protein